MDDELRRLAEEVNLLRQNQLQLQQRLETVSRQLASLAGNEPAASGSAAPVKAPPPVRPAAVPSHAEKPPQTRPEKTSSSLETRIGGIWLNRVGVVVCLFAVAFFLKLAFDKGWINELTRIIIGGGAGLLLLGLGERTRRKGYAGYGQGLTGGGIAVLYFTIYAAFSFYKILPPPAAMGLMVAVTILAVVLAVYQDAPAVAILGLLAGFLTPFLFPSPEPRFLPVLLYLLLLNLGIVAVAYFKRWALIGTTAFIVTHLILAGMLAYRLLERPVPDIGPAVFQVFLSLFFLLFLALPLLLIYARKSPFKALGVFLLAAGAASFYSLSWFNLKPLYPDQMGLFTAGLAGFYFLAGLGLRRLSFRDSGASFAAFSLGTALLVLFIPVQLKQAWITVGWTLQAAILCYLGLRLADRKIRAGFWLVLGLALGRLLFAEWPLFINPAEYRFLINRAAVLTFFLIAVLIFCAWLYGRFRAAGKGKWNEMSILAGAAGLLFLIFGSLDIARYREAAALLRADSWFYYRNLAMLATSLFWGCYAAALIIAGFIRKQPLLRYAAFVLFAVTVVKVALVDLSFLDLAYRVISLVVLGVILLAVSYLYQSHRARIE